MDINLRYNIRISLKQKRRGKEGKEKWVAVVLLYS